MHRAVVLLSARVSPAASLGTRLSSCAVWTISTSHRLPPQCCHFATPEFRYDASGIWTIFRFEYHDRAVNTGTNHKRPKTDQKATRKRPERMEVRYLRADKGTTLHLKEGNGTSLRATRRSIKRKLASLQERIKRISFPKNVINDKKRELGTALIYGFRKLNIKHLR